MGSQNQLSINTKRLFRFKKPETRGCINSTDPTTITIETSTTIIEAKKKSSNKQALNSKIDYIH